MSTNPRIHAAPASKGLLFTFLRVDFGQSAWATLNRARWSFTGIGMVIVLFALPEEWWLSTVARPVAIRSHAAQRMGSVPCIRASGLDSPHRQRAATPTRRAATAFRR